MSRPRHNHPEDPSGKGIHPLLEQKKVGIIDLSHEKLSVLDDITSHINGNDGVSLSKTNLTDLYPDEDVYNPYKHDAVDVIIDGIDAKRMTTHYGNEFVHEGSILLEKFLSFDIRLLRLLESAKNMNDLLLLKQVVENINILKEIAICMQKKRLYIPIREMSYEKSHENGLCLDRDKLATMPKIFVKK